ncbi:MAG TPA: hypothetical protein VF719_12030 [Abditibacteriaceae bacterium]
MTVQQMFEFLYLQLVEALGEEGKEDEDEIRRICEATGRIGSAAEHYKDWKVDEICDEFSYIGSHTKMVRWKSDAQMPILKAIIQDLPTV